MPITKEDAPDVLPSHAQDIYVSAWNSGYEGTCEGREDRDECASKIAWSAVKEKYKKSGEKWVPKSLPVTELSLYISKASLNKKTQQMRGVAVASDTKEDAFGDNMSLELYKDFIDRINGDQKAPEKFRSDYWVGGMPYLSIAHYSDQNGEAIPGDIESVYVDGNRLKQKFTLRNNTVGKAIFDAICDDLYSEEPEHENPIRLSIGFIDWKHKHKASDFVFERESLSDICPECLSEAENGDGEGKIYLRGQLIHSAFTRVPVNPRTEIESIEERSMPKTRKEDAASMIGEEEAEELEQREKIVGRSEALVVKSEEEDEDVTDEVGATVQSEEEVQEAIDESEKLIKEFEDIDEALDWLEKNPDGEAVVPLSMTELSKVKAEEINEEEEMSMLQKDHPLSEALQAFSEAYNTLPDATVQERLQALQPAFNELGEAIREVEEHGEVQEVPEQSGDLDLNSLTEALTKAVRAGNEPLMKELSIIKAGLSERGTASQVPPRRSVSPSLVRQSQTNEQEEKPKVSPLSQAINESVGLDPNYVRPGASLVEEE